MGVLCMTSSALVALCEHIDRADPGVPHHIHSVGGCNCLLSGAAFWLPLKEHEVFWFVGRQPTSLPDRNPLLFNLSSTPKTWDPLVDGAAAERSLPASWGFPSSAPMGKRFWTCPRTHAFGVPRGRAICEAPSRCFAAAFGTGCG